MFDKKYIIFSLCLIPNYLRKVAGLICEVSCPALPNFQVDMFIQIYVFYGLPCFFFSKCVCIAIQYVLLFIFGDLFHFFLEYIFHMLLFQSCSVVFWLSVSSQKSSSTCALYMVGTLALLIAVVAFYSIFTFGACLSYLGYFPVLEV